MRDNALTIADEYFDHILFKQRLIDAVVPSTEMTLWGETFSTPIMSAALSHLGPGELVGITQACANVNALAWYGLGEDEELEALTATGAKVVKIIKPLADEKRIYHEIEHAKACGTFAVGMDIDHAFDGKGEPDVCLGLLMEPKTSKQLSEYIQAAHDLNLPFIIKGVTSEEDAIKCRDLGADGIVVSNHNGVIPCSVAALMVLPDIKKAVGDCNMKIFMDGQIKSGVDAYKALALGADAVCVGKALMPIVHEGGVEAVEKTLNTMTTEVKRMMARTGYATVAEIDDRCVYID